VIVVPVYNAYEDAVQCLDAVMAHTSAAHAILVVDKHVEALKRIADRHVVIEKGRVVWSGTSAQLTADVSVRERYLQV